MSSDLRIKYSKETRNKCAELFESGFGYCSVATLLNISKYAVRDWYYIYSSLGHEELMNMGGIQNKYTFEQKLAATKAVVEDGMTKEEVMKKYKIKSHSSLKRWCRAYKTNGVEALHEKLEVDHNA